MNKHYIRLRVWEDTGRQLKAMAALSGETMIAFVHRLACEERDRRTRCLTEKDRLLLRVEDILYEPEKD
jgi:uncharacterized protein (DUF1778 family)